MPAGGAKLKTAEGGDISRKYYVNPKMQQRHIWHTAGYAQREKESIRDGVEKPTRLKGNVKFAQTLVDKYAGTGIIHNKKDGSRSEVIKASSAVGRYLDTASNKWKKTKWFTIVYAKRGVHIFPMKSPYRKEGESK
jgi:hypothetical protein